MATISISADKIACSCGKVRCFAKALKGAPFVGFFLDVKSPCSEFDISLACRARNFGPFRQYSRFLDKLAGDLVRSDWTGLIIGPLARRLDFSRGVKCQFAVSITF